MIMECYTTTSKTLEIWNNGVRSIIHIPISMGTVEPVMASSVPVSRAVPSPLAKVQIGEGRTKNGNAVEIVINDDPIGDDLITATTDSTESNSQATFPQAQVKNNINIQPASTKTTNTIDFRMSTQIVSSQYPVTSVSPLLLSTNSSSEATCVVNSSDSSVKNVSTPQHFNMIARPSFRNFLIQNPGNAAPGPRRFFGICPQDLQQQQSIQLQQQHTQAQFRPIQKYLQQFQPFPQQIKQLQQQIKHLPQYIQQMPEQSHPVSHNSHQFPQYIQQQVNYGNFPYLDPQQATSINTVHYQPSFHKDVQNLGNVSFYLNKPPWLQAGQQSQPGIRPIIINFSTSQAVAANPPSLNNSSHTIVPTSVLTSDFVEKIIQSAADGVPVRVSQSASGLHASPVPSAKKSKRKDSRAVLSKNIPLNPSLTMPAMTNEIPDLSNPTSHCRSSLDEDLQLDSNPKTTASNLHVLEENDSGVASVEGKKGSPSSDPFSFSTEEICKDQEMFFADAVNTFNKGIEEGDILNLLDGLLQEDESEEATSSNVAMTTETVNQVKSTEKSQANLAYLKSIKGSEAIEAARQARYQKRKEMFERSSDEKSSGSWVPEEHIPESCSSWDSEHSVTMGKRNKKKKLQHVSETKDVLKSKSHLPAKLKKYKLRSQDKKSREESCSSRSSSLTSLRSSITSSSIVSSSYSSTPSLPVSLTNSTKSSCASSSNNLSKTGKRKATTRNKTNESKKKSTDFVVPDRSVAESERLPDGSGIKIRIKIRSPNKKNSPLQLRTDGLKRCFVNLEKLNIESNDYVVNLKKSHKKILCCEKSQKKVGIKKSSTTTTSKSSDEECVVKRPVKRGRKVLLTSDESG